VLGKHHALAIQVERAATEGVNCLVDIQHNLLANYADPDQSGLCNG
jgi:hypothetical protein